MDISSINKDFEQIKRYDNDYVEYWDARELMPLLGYSTWESFEKVIRKSIVSMSKIYPQTNEHFREVTKMYKIAAGTKNEATGSKRDYQLTRYACYLIAQNGDSSKEQIAIAQTYFAVQTRKQEIQEIDNEDQKRVHIRDEVTEQNKRLSSTARNAGVKNFGKFTNAGYEGLYGMKSSQIKKKKGIGKDDILDRAGATELAANLFRITQTEEKLRKEETYGEEKASKTHKYVGQEVRNAIKKIGGRMPENLPPQKHIKEVRKNVKTLAKNKDASIIETTNL